MNKTLKVKIIIDICMTVLLLFLMGYQFWGDLYHEIVGTAMFVLFIAHHLLNVKWYKNLFKGKYSLSRVITFVVNVALLVVMIGMMASGILLSRHVFTFLPIEGGAAVGRILHMACSYWGFVLMALHLGLHWNMILGMIKKMRKNKEVTTIGKTIMFVIGTAIAAYGLHVFIRRGLIQYMFLQTQFVFLDFMESKLFFYGEYISMMGLFIYVAHYVRKIFQKLQDRRAK